MMASARFALSVGRIPPTWFSVRSFRGVERMSRLYRFKIDVETAFNGAELDAASLGSTATLFVRVGDEHRQFHGVVSSVRRRDEHRRASHTQELFTLEVVPHAWLLTRRAGSRIFQDRSVTAVIDEVLDAYQLPRKWQLARPRPARVYTTQYEESDWEFVCRLAAENGIFFHFVHPELMELLAGVEGLLTSMESSEPELDALALALGATLRERSPREEIVFTDHASYVPIRGASVPYMTLDGSRSSHDYVHKFQTKRAIRSTQAAFREFDWRRPITPIESARSRGPAPDRPGEPEDLEVYEHHLRDHEADWADEAFEAVRMLETVRRDAVRATGESGSVRLSLGGQFRLDGHPHDDGLYAVTAIRHTGALQTTADAPGAYSSRFEAIPSDVPFPAPRPPRKTIQACLTAIVAGAPDQEIHLNEHGQIKVKFQWDRRDERADPTCWLRCMHPWASNGWGFQFIPRVGMEVVVAFEGGDPDRPMVLGCVYNGITPEPFTLPQKKTRSGIRTRSTPKSDGYNELSFEDDAGKEQVYLRAQRDYDSLAQRDRTARIGRDDHETVQGSQTIEVGGDQRLTVHKDQEVCVRGEVNETTLGSHQVTRKDLVTTIHEERTDHIGGTQETQIRGARASHVRSWSVDRVDGNCTQLVGHGTSGGNWAVDVKGAGSLHSGSSITLRAHEDITLCVGDSLIRIGSDQIEIVSPTVVVRGKDARMKLSAGECKLYSKSNCQVVSDAGIVLKAQVASLGLQNEAKIDGAQILLNSPAQATDSLESAPEITTDVTLRGSDGKPVKHALFQVRFEDGRVFTGLTDDDGKAVITESGEGEIEFLEHTNPREE